MKPKQIYSVSFVAKELGITRGHVYKLVKEKELTSPYYYMVNASGVEVMAWTMAQIEEMKVSYIRKRK